MFRKPYLPTSPSNPSSGTLKKPRGRADQKKVIEKDDPARFQGNENIMESSELDYMKPSLQESYCEGPICSDWSQRQIQGEG